MAQPPLGQRDPQSWASSLEPEGGSPDEPPIEWRQTGRSLWVGARDGRHVGIIEHGRGFIAVDGRGAVVGRFKTLELAQQALASASADDVRERKQA